MSPTRLKTALLGITILCTVLVGLERSGLLPALRPLTGELYIWMLVLSACVLLLGVFNVAHVHWQRIRLGEREWGLSVVLLAMLLAVAGAGLLDSAGVFNPAVVWFFDSVIAPLQASLFALTVFFLAGAAYRYLRVQYRGGAWVVAGALLVLLVQAPLGRAILPEEVDAATNWLVSYPVTAALRGVLLGSSLALMLIGVRFLLHSNSPGPNSQGPNSQSRDSQSRDS